MDEYLKRRRAEIRGEHEDTEPTEGDGQLSKLRRENAALREALGKLKAVPPARVDLMASGSPAADMERWRRAHGLDDDPSVTYVDRVAVASSPNARALGELERQRAEQQRLAERAALLAEGALDMRTASTAQAARRFAAPVSFANACDSSGVGWMPTRSR